MNNKFNVGDEIICSNLSPCKLGAVRVAKYILVSALADDGVTTGIWANDGRMYHVNQTYSFSRDGINKLYEMKVDKLISSLESLRKEKDDLLELL